MNRQLKKLGMPLAVFLLLPAAAAWAQTGAGSAAANKIGVINIRQAIVTTAEGKQASSQLQTQFNPQQAILKTCRNRFRIFRVGSPMAPAR